MKAFIEESKESTQSRAEKGGAKCRDKATEDSDFLLSHFLLKEDRKKLKVEKEGSDVYEQNEPQIEKADQGEIPLSIGYEIASHLAVLTPLAYRSSVQKPRPRTCIEKDFPRRSSSSIPT
ncbi:hypothetical protein L1887_46860 [Cichorium endivia]|nr:hypothetical protein L1887_46860 [Cichorium endivia]